MNPTVEAWFAVVGVLTIAAGVALGLMLLWALVTGKLPGAAPRKAKAGTEPEYPEPRTHDRGECWCGDTHRPAEDHEVWSAS